MLLCTEEVYSWMGKTQRKGTRGDRIIEMWMEGNLNIRTYSLFVDVVWILHFSHTENFWHIAQMLVLVSDKL